MTVDSLGRALQLYRRTATSRSALLLIVANLIPLVGVLLFGWSLWTLLVLYWIENGIVGFWNVPKLLLARGAFAPLPPASEPAPGRAFPGDRSAGRSSVRVFGSPVDGTAGRVGLALFFMVHYGGFWFGHGVFVFLLPTFVGGGTEVVGGCGGPNPLGQLPGCEAPMGEIVWSNVLIAAIALFISHGASFLFNYIGRAEYLTASPMGQMAAPYGRVIVLHLTILFGAFVVAFLGTPIGALLLLVGLKIAFDLGLHLRERRTADARIPTGNAYGQALRGS